MGTLYIVSTPIGNLKDLTFRALETLERVDYVLCEDTRVTVKLLNHYFLKKQMVSFNDFNENAKTQSVLNDLTSGKDIALVSDAGTPLISDPGFKLVRESINKGIMVKAIPGPSAIITSLIISGMPPDKFIFLGYLPKKEIQLEKTFFTLKKSLENVNSTAIFYESPYRLVNTLIIIKRVFGNIDVVVCRELTKIHEEILRDKVSILIDYFSKTRPKGELVVLCSLK